MNLNHLLYEKVNRRLALDFPKTLAMMKQLEMEVDWQYLLSPLPVDLSKKALERAKNGVLAIHSVSRMAAYQSQVAEQELLSTKNESALMSYDFHSSQQGRLALIEINTNASGYLIACLGLAAENDISVHSLDEIQKLKKSFETELELNGQTSEGIHVAIVDEDIQNQKMRVEFLFYKELFEKWGWSAEICESGEVSWNENQQQLISSQGKKIDLVYNRTTDFLFESEQHRGLRDALLSQKVTITPQPKEYLLLADKTQLLKFQSPEKLQSLGVDEGLIKDISEIVLPVSEIKSFTDKEELWKNRKTLFFKPKNSYGGKAVYRGESVSRKVFERLLEEDGLVQNFFPAQKLSEDPTHPLNIWKFDLRVYVYRSEIQFITARVYQGQVTNFSNRMGGFSSIQVTS